MTSGSGMSAHPIGLVNVSDDVCCALVCGAITNVASSRTRSSLIAFVLLLFTNSKDTSFTLTKLTVGGTKWQEKGGMAEN